MRIKTIVAAALLAAAPTLALAEGCGWGHIEKQVSTCGEGQMFDEKTMTCVDQATS